MRKVLRSAEHSIEGVKAEPVPAVFSYYSSGLDSWLFTDALVNTHARVVV
jgi:hypothetical protein